MRARACSAVVADVVMVANSCTANLIGLMYCYSDRGNQRELLTSMFCYRENVSSHESELAGSWSCVAGDKNDGSIKGKSWLVEELCR